MKFKVIASGSKGNSTVILTDNRYGNFLSNSKKEFRRGFPFFR